MMLARSSTNIEEADNRLSGKMSTSVCWTSSHHPIAPPASKRSMQWFKCWLQHQICGFSRPQQVIMPSQSNQKVLVIQFLYYWPSKKTFSSFLALMCPTNVVKSSPANLMLITTSLSGCWPRTSLDWHLLLYWMIMLLAMICSNITTWGQERESATAIVCQCVGSECKVS